MTRLITSIADLTAYRAGLEGTVALVPTMGALHDGHLTLIARAKELADHVIVSDFVNPLQFGPGEDFEKYPRDIVADLALVEGVASALFAPSVEEMYPAAEPFQVSVGHVGKVFEGKFRPGHFDGVATVVLKLFLIARPDIAIFGEKDAQQLQIVRRLVSDFNVPVRIEAVPIVRDSRGLARSSRNAYLSKRGLEDALALSSVVSRAKEQENARALLDILGSLENTEAVTWDYAEALDPETLERITEDFRGEALVVLAARVEGVRLLDNTRVRL